MTAMSAARPIKCFRDFSLENFVRIPITNQPSRSLESRSDSEEDGGQRTNPVSAISHENIFDAHYMQKQKTVVVLVLGVILVIVLGVVLFVYFGRPPPLREGETLLDSSVRPPPSYNCGGPRWNQYMEHLYTENFVMWKQVSEYVLNHPPHQSMALLTQMCNFLESNTSFGAIDTDIPAMIAVANSILAPTHAAVVDPSSTTAGPAPTPTPASAPTPAPAPAPAPDGFEESRALSQEILDFIAETFDDTFQGCDMVKLEAYLQEYPDDVKDLDALYQNSVNSDFDYNITRKLTEKLQRLCKASSRISSTSSTSSTSATSSTSSTSSTSFQGWMLSVPNLTDTLTSQTSCPISLIQSFIDSSSQRTQIYEYLNKVRDVRDQADILQWMCHALQVSDHKIVDYGVSQLLKQAPPTEDNPLDRSKISFQDPNNTNPADKSAAAMADGADNMVMLGGDMTEEELELALQKLSPEQRKDWEAQMAQEKYASAPQGAINPITKFNFKNFDEWQVANYDVNPALWAARDSARCEPKIAEFMDKSKLKTEIYKELDISGMDISGMDQQTRQLNFFQHLCNKLNENVGYVPSSLDELKRFFNTSLYEVHPTPLKPKPTLPANINTMSTNYTRKGYVTDSLIIKNRTINFNTNSYGPYFYQTPMKDIEVGPNDKTLKQIFFNFIAGNPDLLPPNVADASSKTKTPYFVVFWTDSNNVCQNIAGIGFDDYNTVLDSNLSPTPVKAKDGGDMTISIWVIDDVDKALETPSATAAGVKTQKEKYGEAQPTPTKANAPPKKVGATKTTAPAKKVGATASTTTTTTTAAPLKTIAPEPSYTYINLFDTGNDISTKPLNNKTIAPAPEPLYPKFDWFDTGNDISTSPLTNQTILGCQTQCTNNINCQGFTFDAHKTDGKYSCWFKNGFTQATIKPSDYDAPTLRATYVNPNVTLHATYVNPKRFTGSIEPPPSCQDLIESYNKHITDRKNKYLQSKQLDEQMGQIFNPKHYNKMIEVRDWITKDSLPPTQTITNVELQQILDRVTCFIMRNVKNGDMENARMKEIDVRHASLAWYVGNSMYIKRLILMSTDNIDYPEVREKVIRFLRYKHADFARILNNKMRIEEKKTSRPLRDWVIEEIDGELMNLIG